MAQVRLGRYEAENKQLPAVCMRCGQPAEFWKSKKFTWRPPWIIILVLAAVIPYFVVAAILQKKMLVRAPLCRQHRNHWFQKVIANIAYFVFLALLYFLGASLQWVAISVPARAAPAQEIRDTAQAALCFGGIVALLGWLVMNVIFDEVLIHAGEIDETSITLKRVADGFVDAVIEKNHAGRPEAGQQVRPAKKNQANDDDDDFD